MRRLSLTSLSAFVLACVLLSVATVSGPAEQAKDDLNPKIVPTIGHHDEVTSVSFSPDPQAWLADVLARLPDHPAKRIHELLPWNWRRHNLAAEAA
jgi:hypothetical protein